MAMQNQNSRYCTITLNVLMGIAGISVSYPITSLNPVTPVIRRIYNRTYFERYGEPIPDSVWTPLLSFTMSIIFISAFISSLFSKMLTSRFTKKRLLIATHVINIVGYAIIGIGVSVWGSYEAFIFGRFVIGLAIGLGLGVYGVFVNELCVPHQRSLYAGLLGTWYVIGALVGILIGWPRVFGTDELWLGVIIFGIAISAIYLACAYWITDSPLQVMLTEGPDAAVRILRRLRIGEGSEFETEMKTLTGSDNDSDKTTTSSDDAPIGFLEVMRTPQYRKHFFATVIVYSNVMACGLSNILFFSDGILMNAGLDPETVTSGTIGVFAIGPVVSVAAIFAMKRLDPRILALIGSVIVVAGDALMIASLATKEQLPAMSVVSVVAMCTFFFGFSIINMTAYVITAAICIDKTRAVTMMVATMGFWFFGWFVGFISPYLDTWMGPYAFVVWMTISTAIAVYVYFCVPNISGKTEDEIQRFYKSPTRMSKA